ncbi:MAG: rRNA maturation RNase YbeY [Pseudomonadota bacterium]
MIETDVLIETGWPDGVDWAALGVNAVNAAIACTPYGALADSDATIGVSIKLTDNQEVRALNRDFRGQDKATNVLSFPMVVRDMLGGIANTDDGEVLLGDIVLALGVCTVEAEARQISVAAHATHLIVHGTLHLLGYDHMDDGEADAMEALEQVVMASLGLHNPYEAIED